jgi:hypothetical protein
MKQCLSILWAFCVLAPFTFAQDVQTAPIEKPRAFITESQSWETRASSGGSHGIFGGSASGGARPQTVEIIKTFGERCPSVLVNNLQEKSDFIVLVDHEGGKGLLQHKNKVAVFERTSGDTVISKSTLSLGGGVQEACDAIAKYWADNGARLLKAKAAQETPEMPPPTPNPSASAPVLASAQLAISSSPVGADIEIDGGFVGSTPSSIDTTPGDHVVIIRKKGFKDWERKVKISGGSISLSADLDPAS